MVCQRPPSIARLIPARARQPIPNSVVRPPPAPFVDFPPGPVHSFFRPQAVPRGALINVEPERHPPVPVGPGGGPGSPGHPEGPAPAADDTPTDAVHGTLSQDPTSHPGETALSTTEPLPDAGHSRRDPLVGTLLAGQFQVERPLGRGGMGLVYVARQLGTSRTVALKLLRPDVPDPAMQQRFLREAEILARLQHPNIVTIFAVGQTPDGQCFMAMEYLEGRTLAFELREGPLPLERLLRIAEQLARALVAAHHQGIVHRDLKPQNVMLIETPGGEPDGVKVLDFGIARLEADEDSSLTREGVVIGTPEYLSPEQARGGRVDTRSDLYSLGLILYRAATGAPAVEARTPLDYLRAHALEAPRPIERAGKGRQLPAEFARIVMHLLAKDPGQRPAAEEVLEVVKRLRADMASATRTPAFPRQRRRAWIAAGSALVLLGGGLAWMLLGRGEVESPEPSPAGEPASASAVPTGVEPRATPSPVPDPAASPQAATPSPPPVVPPPPPAAAPASSPPSTPAAPPLARPERRAPSASAPRPREAPARDAVWTDCGQVLARLDGHLAALSRHPEEKDSRCRSVKGLVGQAERRRCLIPAELGTRTMACF